MSHKDSKTITRPPSSDTGHLVGITVEGDRDPITVVEPFDRALVTDTSPYGAVDKKMRDALQNTPPPFKVVSPQSASGDTAIVDLADISAGVQKKPKPAFPKDFRDTGDKPVNGDHYQDLGDNTPWYQSIWARLSTLVFVLALAGFSFFSLDKKPTASQNNTTAQVAVDVKKASSNDHVDQKVEVSKEGKSEGFKPILPKKVVQKESVVAPTDTQAQPKPVVKEVPPVVGAKADNAKKQKDVEHPKVPLVPEGVYVYKEGDVLWTVAKTHGKKPWTVIFNNRSKYLARCLETNKQSDCNHDKWANYLKAGDHIILSFPKHNVKPLVASVTVQPKEKTLFEVSDRVNMNVWHLYWINDVELENACKLQHHKKPWKCTSGAWAHRLTPGTVIKTEGKYIKRVKRNRSNKRNKAKESNSGVFRRVEVLTVPKQVAIKLEIEDKIKSKPPKRTISASEMGRLISEAQHPKLQHVANQTNISFD